MREKLVFIISQPKCHRITPACAGKTEDGPQGTGVSRDHPRVCGKNVASVAAGLCYGGSPPRVREKLVVFFILSNKFGITPACAGKTRNVADCWFMGWDHPRVCGKNCNLLTYVLRRRGSPPRVREKLRFE